MKNKKPTDLRLVRGGIVYYPQEEVYKLQNESHNKGFNSALDEVGKIIEQFEIDNHLKVEGKSIRSFIKLKEKIKEMRK